jgi:hypothetical protein
MAKAMPTRETLPHGGRAPSRIGKKGVTFYLKPDAMKQLRTIAIEEESSLQSLMLEAANLLFKSRRKPEIAQ